MPRGAWTVVCLVTLALVAGAQAETVTLKARFEPGTYVMTTKVDMVNTSTMSTGQSMEQKIAMTTVAEMEVGPRDAEGMLTIRLTFKRVAQSMEGSGVSMAYDSVDPASGNQMLAATLTPMLEHPVTIKMDANDKVVSASGLDEAWDALASENPNMAAMAKGMKEQWGNTYATRMVDWPAKMMPPGPVAVGDSWDANRTEALPTLGEASVKQRCTLKEVKSTPAGKVAVIAFTSSVEKDQVKGPEPGAQMAVTFSGIKIGQDGTVEMLLDSGMPLSRLADQKTSMNVSVKPQEGAQGAPESATQNITVQQGGKVEATMQKGKYSPPATAASTRPAAAAP